MDQSAPSRRSAPRVDFSSRILLQPTGRKELVQANTINLGHGGIFVSATRLHDVDTELLFDLPLPDGAIRMRGRVAWVRPPVVGQGAPAGMGIAFVDLSDDHQQRLRQVMAELLGRHTPLSVEFVGHDLSLRATGVINSDSVSLVVSLPFLRPGSPTRVSLRDDWQLESEIRRARFEAGPTPRLRLDLRVPALLTDPVSGAFRSGPVREALLPLAGEPSVHVDLSQPQRQTVKLHRPTRKRRRRRPRQIALPRWLVAAGGVALLFGFSALALLLTHWL